MTGVQTCALPISFITAGGPEATSAVAFPFGSSVVSLEGAAVAMVNEGCRRIARLGTPNGGDSFQKGLASKGVELLFDALTPSDPAPVIAALVARNVDCLYIGGAEASIRNVILAADQAGRSFRYAWLGEFVSTNAMALLGPSIDNALIISNTPIGFDTTDPTVRQFRSELDQYYPGQKYANGLAPWGNVDLLIQVMKTIDGDINAPSVLNALRGFKGNTKLYGPVDLTKERANKAYQRLFVANAFVYHVVNAKPVRFGEPLNLSALLDAN